MAETHRNNLIYALPLTVIVTTSQSLSHVLATASSERDGGQREGTTQRMRPVSAAARVARPVHCNSQGVFIFTSIHAKHRWDIWVAYDRRLLRTRPALAKRNPNRSAPRQNLFYLAVCKTLAHCARLLLAPAYNCC